jgi:hypothetical protein
VTRCRHCMGASASPGCPGARACHAEAVMARPPPRGPGCAGGAVAAPTRRRPHDAVPPLRRGSRPRRHPAPRPSLRWRSRPRNRSQPRPPTHARRHGRSPRRHRSSMRRARLSQQVCEAAAPPA